jgi:hypothetical protein
MASSKKYFHDHLVLLLLSVNTFLALAGSVFVLVKLNASHATSYIVQYRPSLGADAFQTGSLTDLLSLIAFFIVILAAGTVLSLRAYNIHRQLAITILGLGIVLMIVAVVISNALLMLR